MRSYGANKATEFTKKQINVIFAKAKAGELKVESWIMKDFYNLADYYGYDDNGAVERAEQKVKDIIEAAFAGDIEKAQKGIDAYTESELNSLTDKRKAEIDRSLI